jgi:phosphotransferase system  glucose/maltose/N-acetylglucosamine-specific IIC component
LNSNHTQDPKSEAFSRTGTPAAAAAATRKKKKKKKKREKEILPRRSVQHGKIV